MNAYIGVVAVEGEAVRHLSVLELPAKAKQRHLLVRICAYIDTHVSYIGQKGSGRI